MKRVRLLFVAEGTPYDKERASTLAYAPGKYCTVYECPAREMLTATPEALAAELLALTNEPEWVARRTRPIAYGDVMMLDGDAWLFAPDTDVEHLKCHADCSEAFPLPRWPKAAIAHLRHEIIPCNSQN